MSAIAQALNLAARHQQAGNLAQAEQIGRQVLEADPGNVRALHLLGLVALGAGDTTLALDYLNQAVQLKPDFVAAHCTLGVAYQRQEQWPAAVDCWRRALALNPAHAEAQNNLAVVLHMQGDRQAAIAGWQQAIDCKPDYADAYFNLASGFYGMGQFEAAAGVYRQLVRLQPDHAEAYNGLGNVLMDVGKYVEAATCYRQALQLVPGYLHAWVNLGAALQAQGRLAESGWCYQQALAYDGGTASTPHDRANVYNNLGNVLRAQGKLPDALAAFRQAAQCDPQFALPHSNRLLTMQYLPGISPAELARAHAEFDQQHAARLRSAWKSHPRVRDPQRTLRLGLVSADLSCHPVGYFLIKALENIDRCAVAVLCYSDRPTADALTQRFQAVATGWRDTFGWDDARLDQQIRQDHIDILIDLAGHTARNRLLVFARKPAPLQLTWAGYVGTTGLAAIDYLVADSWHVPPGAEPYYRERVLRLPDCYVCYEPPCYAPAVGSLPASSAGHVTFGSFNNPAKIGAEVVRLWAALMRQIPGSRLVLKYRGMSDPSVAGRLTALFAGQGVDPRRVECLDYSAHPELLQHYNRIDIALDPFPYSGGLTTCEALWMGVPVITYPGETFAGRHTLSYLSAVGLTETICGSPADYETTAVELAGNLPRLADLRRGLRQRMASSPLCNAPRFAQNLLTLLRGAWREYCAQA